MKRFKMFISILLCLFLFSGCASSNQEASSSNTIYLAGYNSTKQEETLINIKKDIKFYTIYNDFVITPDDGKEHPDTINTFDDIGTWGAFKKDFSEVKLPNVSLATRTLICMKVTPVKSTYALSQYYIDHIALNNDILTVYLNDTGIVSPVIEEATGKRVCNLILATVNAQEIPKNVKVRMVSLI